MSPNLATTTDFRRLIIDIFSNAMVKCLKKGICKRTFFPVYLALRSLGARAFSVWIEWGVQVITIIV